MQNFNKNWKPNLKERERITKVHMVNVIMLIQMYERRAVKMQDSDTSNILPSRNKRKQDYTCHNKWKIIALKTCTSSPRKSVLLIMLTTNALILPSSGHWIVALIHLETNWVALRIQTNTSGNFTHQVILSFTGWCWKWHTHPNGKSHNQY